MRILGQKAYAILLLLKLFTTVSSQYDIFDPEINVASSKQWPIMGDDPSKTRSYDMEYTAPPDYVVRLSSPSVGKSGLKSKKDRKKYRSLLLAEQEKIIQRLKKSEPELEVLAKTQLAINAIYVRMPSQSKEKLMSDVSVTRITRVGKYKLNLLDSVPSIGGHSDIVRKNCLDGKGVKIAVFDSGIDYTHKNLGGKGTIDAFEDAYGIFNSTERDNHTRREGLFPTDKVVEGYDFVGELSPYTADFRLEPDDDPIDIEGHGTSVADIIAGKNGVAPGASLIAVKVCYASGDSCDGIAMMMGIEYAIEQEVDIMNWSLGADYAMPFDDEASYALKNAHDDFGILSVAAAGNCRDRPYCLNVPASEPTVLAVAQTVKPNKYMQAINVAGTNYRTIYVPWNEKWNETLVSAPLFFETGMGNSSFGCDPFEEGHLDGYIVIFNRGTCEEIQKVINIERGGGVAAIMIDDVRQVPYYPEFYWDIYPNISTAFIRMVDGEEIVKKYKDAYMTDSSIMATLDYSNEIEISLHEVAGSSARGPDNSYNRIKPEIGAPGEVLSAIAGSGDKEKYFGGTSGATPMVAGAAALIKQSCPTCTPLEIKSLLMNNADREMIKSTTGGPAEITRIGAGRLQVDKALSASFWAYCLTDEQPSLSLGLIDAAQDVRVKKTIRIFNKFKKKQKLKLSVLFRLDWYHESGAIDIRFKHDGNNVKNIDLKPHGCTDVEVIFYLQSKFMNPNAMSSGVNSMDPLSLNTNELDGYIILKSSTQDVALPWHVLGRQAADVEVIVENIEKDGPIIDYDNTPKDKNTPSLGMSMQLSIANRGSGVAQINAFSILALSEEKRKGSAGEEMPTPDIKSIGYRTFYTDACPSEIAIEFAISTWYRQQHLTFAAELLFDVDGDGVYDIVMFNSPDPSGVIPDSRFLSWTIEIPPNVTNATEIFYDTPYLDDFPHLSADFEEEFNPIPHFYVSHATNTKNTLSTICGHVLGLSHPKYESMLPPLDDIANIKVKARLHDLFFSGPSDRTTAFQFTPKISNVTTTFDIPPSSDVHQVTVAFDHESKGVMLVADSYRDLTNTGAATEETELTLLLLDDVQPPQPLEDDGILHDGNK